MEKVFTETQTAIKTTFKVNRVWINLKLAVERKNSMGLRLVLT